MAKELLTIAQIEKAEPKTKEYLLNDGANLLLKVLPSGTKAFYFIAYRVEQGKRIAVKKSLGKYPKISLEQARQKAQKERERLANIGKDEINAKFGDYFLEYMKNKKQGLREGSAKILEACYNNHFIKLADLKLYNISRKDILRALEPLISGNKQTTLKIALSFLNGFLEYSLQFERIPENPLKKINVKFLLPSKKETQHNPHLKDLQSVLEFKEKLLNINAYPATKQALITILYTAVRVNEALKAQWCEIDFNKGLWTIPAERMKNKKTFVIPLSTQLLEFLKELKKGAMDEQELIFKSKQRKCLKRQNISNIIEKLGYKNILTTHGLRGTLASIANDLRAEHGLNNDIIQASLSHATQNAVASAYNHSIYLDERKKLLQWWGDKLGAIL